MAQIGDLEPPPNGFSDRRASVHAANPRKSGTISGLTQRLRIEQNQLVIVAGAGGFEPPYAGIKIRCLTTWLRPNFQ